MELSLTGQFTLWERWNLNATVGGELGQYKLLYAGKVDIVNDWGVYVFWSNEVNILTGFSASLDIWGRLIEQDLYNKDIYPKFSVDLGLKKSFFKNQLTLNLSIEDLLNTYRRTMKTELPDGSWSESSIYWESRTLWLKVYYNFGRTIAERKRNREASMDAQDAGRLNNGR